jgi:hypothetical protein
MARRELAFAGSPRACSGGSVADIDLAHRRLVEQSNAMQSGRRLVDGCRKVALRAFGGLMLISAIAIDFLQIGFP